MGGGGSRVCFVGVLQSSTITGHIMGFSTITCVFLSEGKGDEPSLLVFYNLAIPQIMS